MSKTPIERTDATWSPVTGRTNVTCRPEALGEPMEWMSPRRVLVCSTSDLFRPVVPNEFVAAVFGVMAACPQHAFRALTKRPERVEEFFAWMDESVREIAATEGIDPPEHAHATYCHVLLHEHYGIRHLWRAHRPGWPLPNVWIGPSKKPRGVAE